MSEEAILQRIKVNEKTGARNSLARERERENARIIGREVLVDIFGVALRVTEKNSLGARVEPESACGQCMASRDQETCHSKRCLSTYVIEVLWVLVGCDFHIDLTESALFFCGVLSTVSAVSIAPRPK